ncbi:MAG: response regulator [Thermodesulfobacteriota bacterium]
MSKKILIIDDDKHVRYSFALTLGDKGYIVNAVESGEEGIDELSKNNDYDLIFLDLKMQGMDGVETLKNIRSINDKIPVYIVTAFQEEYFPNLKDIAHEELKFELLTKPLDRNQILMTTGMVFDNP